VKNIKNLLTERLYRINMTDEFRPRFQGPEHMWILIFKGSTVDLFTFRSDEPILNNQLENQCKNG
jgi:hypothetical protein